MSTKFILWNNVISKNLINQEGFGLTKIARTNIDSKGDGFHTRVEPKDAATLIIIDRAAPEPRVLFGRRHERHVFMPGKFVFPGGRVDAADRDMPAAEMLPPGIASKLLVSTRFQTNRDAVALALAAIRETFEETGLVIGARATVAGVVPSGPWTAFVQTGFYPDLSCIQFVARAITPPGFPQRFDARFFCADAATIAHRLENVVNADAELVELVWLPISAASRLDLPVITGLVLEELQSVLTKDLRTDLPVPFYNTHEGEFTRELIV